MPLSSDKHIIDQKFAEALQKHTMQPSGRVWSKVSQSLQSEKVSQTHRGRYTMLILLLLLLGGGGIWLSQPGNRGDKISDRSSTNVTDGNSNNKTTSTSVSDNTGGLPNSTESNKSVGSGSHLIASSSHSPYSTCTKLNIDDPITYSNSACLYSFEHINHIACGEKEMEALGSKNQLLSWTSRIHYKKEYYRHSPDVKVVSSPNYYRPNIKGFYVGFGQLMNSVWILDHNAITSKTLKYEPTFGTSLMVQGGYNLSNRWGVEGAWTIHSTEGQKYKYLPIYSRTTSLVYSEKIISFNYMHVPLLVRYKVPGWSGILQIPFFVNYSVGAQYGRLLSLTIDETKENINENHLFRKNEYALVGGIDYDFMMRNSGFFTLGVRTSLGSDLFIKNAPEDLEFERPHNFMVGLHGALNFSFQQRQATVNE